MSDQRAEKHNLLFLMMTNRLNLITGFIGFSFFKGVRSQGLQRCHGEDQLFGQ